MRWPWRKRKSSFNGDRERVQKLHERVEQQAFLSEQTKQTSYELARLTGENKKKAIEMKERNHFGEGMAASFQPKPKAWVLPWRH